MKNQDTILKIRAFNRLYIADMRLFGGNYLGSDYSASEVRVIYEIQRLGVCTASDIVQAIHMDKSYLSRIIKKLEHKNIVQRTVSSTDTRKIDISLTPQGETLYRTLSDLSNQEIGKMVEHLTPSECQRLTDAMETIIRITDKESNWNESRTL